MTNDTKKPQGKLSEAQIEMRLAEQRRDLLALLPDSGPFAGEFEFYEWSPGRREVDLWRMEDGEKITLPQYVALDALNRCIDADGNPRFTAFEENAPAPRRNTIKCFLHPEAPERTALDNLGIVTKCMTDGLASEPSRRRHFENRHPSAWAIWKEHMQTEEAKRAQTVQAEQLEAIKQLGQAVVRNTIGDK